MKLSVVGASVLAMSRPHPWRHFGERWPEVEAHHDLPTSRPWGYTDFSTTPPTVHMYRALRQVERRVTIRHECFHLERGPIPRGGARREEAIVRDLTARWLLPDLDEIREVLGHLDAHAAADHLWVTWSVLVDRLNSLTNIESRHVHQLRGETA